MIAIGKYDLKYAESSIIMFELSAQYHIIKVN
jgi:hypothetical protein